MFLFYHYMVNKDYHSALAKQVDLIIIRKRSNSMWHSTISRETQYHFETIQPFFSVCEVFDMAVDLQQWKRERKQRTVVKAGAYNP